VWIRNKKIKKTSHNVVNKYLIAQVDDNLELRNTDIPDITVETEMEQQEREDWENGMIDKELRRSNIRAEQLQKQRIKNAERLGKERKIKNKFKSSVRFWFDERSYVIWFYCL